MCQTNFLNSTSISLVATNIIALPPGTVVFEDVGTEYYTGQVLKPLDRTFKAISVGIDGKAPDEALNGRVKYRGVDRSEVEVPFGEKDQVCIFIRQITTI